MGKRGVVLFLVLVTVLIAVILANIILSFALNQYRFTHHQTSRVQAYYAAMAGVNYALEQLRVGSPTGWTTASCPSATPCTMSFATGDFKPPSIIGNSVSIIIIPAGESGCINSPGNSSCVKATAEYTYTP